MTLEKRIEIFLKRMKRDNNRIQDAIKEAEEEAFIDFGNAYRARSGVELLAAVDKLFADKWTDKATEMAKDSEFQEEIENRYRRVSAY